MTQEALRQAPKEPARGNYWSPIHIATAAYPAKLALGPWILLCHTDGPDYGAVVKT